MENKKENILDREALSYFTDRMELYFHEGGVENNESWWAWEDLEDIINCIKKRAQSPKQRRLVGGVIMEILEFIGSINGSSDTK